MNYSPLVSSGITKEICVPYLKDEGTKVHTSTLKTVSTTSAHVTACKEMYKNIKQNGRDILFWSFDDGRNPLVYSHFV